MIPSTPLKLVSKTPLHPLLECLAPRIYQTPFKTHRVPITTSSSPPSSEPKPESLKSTSSAKRRRPLSQEQQHFLDSAVSILNVYIRASPQLLNPSSSVSTKPVNSLPP